MAFKKKIKPEVAEAVIESMEEVTPVITDVKVEAPKIPKSRPATGRFFMEVFGKEIGIFNQTGNLVGKEVAVEKARDMVNKFNYILGIK